MKTLEDALNSDSKLLIEEYNTNDKMNTFLYKNKDCEKLLGIDRFKFVTRNNQIAKELIPYVHDNFHGIKCIVKDRRGNEIDGIIQQETTRVFENKTYDNNVSFRRRFENDDYSEPETISLWVVTHDRMTTHLYPCNQIFIES